MSDKQIVWGIIGAGDVAEVKSGPAFQKAENSRLLAVMRRNKARAEDFAKRHNVPLWYHSADDLLKNDDINAVYIATPPSSHKELALKALKAGKHVYLEKPMCMTAQECEEVEKAEAESRGKLVVAHYRRRLPAFMKVEELIKSGVLGTLRFARISIFLPSDSSLIAATDENWRINPKVSGGGLFHDIGPHEIDLMLKYFGPVQQSSGIAMNQSGLNTSDDLVNGRIVFQSGVLLDGLWSFSIDSEDSKQDLCEIYGSEGTLKFSFYGEKIQLCRKGEEEIFEFTNPPHVQQPMIEETVRYFRGEAPNPCSAEEGRECIRVMNSFIQ